MPDDAVQVQPAWLGPDQPRTGRYILGPLLGQGGMGEVREAWDVVLRRTVALKILKTMDPLSLIRFMHEAQLHARLMHPNVCRIYDVESTEGAPRIAMQLVRGETLTEVARKLSVDEIISLFAVVAEAMHAAHRLKLIHRDLKPSNILLERDPEGVWIPYICDFGLAMAMDEPALTYSQGVKGTPAYMAPEQIRGERHLIGPATDVYALGGTLFFALYGEVPGSVCMDAEALMGRRRRPLELPRCPKQALPVELETVLRKCLEPDPALRFSSMATLAAEFRRLRNKEPIHTQPVTTLEAYLPFLRKYRMASYIAIAVAAALILALGLIQRRLVYRNEQRSEWTRFFALEAAELENDLRVEKMLPIHDMRPAYRRLALHMEDVRTRMKTLGDDADGPGLYALGRTRFLLGDYAGAQRDLEQAWGKGSRGPEVAYILARTLVESEYRRENQTPYATGLPQPLDLKGGQRIVSLFREGRGLSSDPDEFARALTAFSQRDYAGAAAAAHASFVTHPWHCESAATEARSLHALGQQKLAAGDLAGAEACYQEAMNAAQRYLSVGQSDLDVQHAFLLAGRGLAHLQLADGSLSLDKLSLLQAHCQEALGLDPGSQDLQDDWLALANLKAARLTDLERDPVPELKAALAYLESRGRQLLSPELKADRMLLHWQLAERQHRLGEDALPELALALEGSGHTPFLGRDYLGEILNFKAQVEAAHGLDPRPTLELCLASLHPLILATPSWSLYETACETWLIRANWEASHSLDASASLGNAQALVDQALQANPASASAYALEGLVWASQREAAPPKRRILTAMARERLQASLSHGPSPRLQSSLRKSVL